MIIGVLKELKNHEYRVGLTPEAAKILIENGHRVWVEKGAGTGAGFSDDDFKKTGALILDGVFIFIKADIVIKVKEPLEEEIKVYERLKEISKSSREFDPIIFAFFHFPANPSVKEFILRNKIRVIPYENIQLPDGSRPVLGAMSKIAAEVAVDATAHYLRKENGGKGILLKDATVAVIGCDGKAGSTAFDILHKRGAYVIGFEKRKMEPMRACHISAEKYEKHYSDHGLLESCLKNVDVVICAAASKGESAPKLITRNILKEMKPGSVIIDIAIDEGGCCETSRPTCHNNPVFVEDGIIHYCVANIPGVVPQSSTPALVEQTLPYILEIANKGWEKALAENSILANAAKIG